MCVVSQMFAFRVNLEFAQRDSTSVPNPSAVSVPARKPVLFWCLFGLKPERLFLQSDAFGVCISQRSHSIVGQEVRGHGVKGGPEVWSVSPWISRRMSAI